jgi:hypothetical protein
MSSSSSVSLSGRFVPCRPGNKPPAPLVGTLDDRPQKWRSFYLIGAIRFRPLTIWPSQTATVSECRFGGSASPQPPIPM